MDSLAVLHYALANRAFRMREEQRMVTQSGDPCRWFFDFRSILLEGPTLTVISELFWKQLKSEVPFQVGGLETAAITLVAGVVLKAKADNVIVNGFYVRKSRKKDGIQQMVEGALGDEKVILIDDGLNSGKSLIRQIELLHLLGKKVHAVCVMVRFRDLSFYRYFHENGIRIISLFTLDDFPETGGIEKYARDNAEKSTSAAHIPFILHWKFESKDPSYFHILPKSAPAIDDERVYFGADNGTLWALNQSDGSVAWSYKTLFGAGKKRIFSSPAVHDGIVYFGAYDGNFYALDAKTGKKKWIYREADWIGSSPCVAEDFGTIFIGLEFGLWNKQGGIAALDLKTGEKRWWRYVKTMVHSSPAHSREYCVVIVGSTSGTVYAFNAKSGEPLWTFQTDGAVRAGFAFDETYGYVCFGSEDKYTYVLNTKNGTLVYKVETLEPIYSTPLVANGRLYFGVLDKRVLCVDLTTGSVLWTFWTSSRIFATPLMVDGHIFIGSNDGRLYELDATTGKEMGYFQTTERIVNKVAYNPTTKRFFVPTYANELYCLERKNE
ncbi:MAG: PQQ-binding-like beta-propeller repeat protein [bacterium]|nr:PQQ-binding-like beta-propeller repeat protein [bacterium]